MEVYPIMDIRFPNAKEAELISTMRAKAQSPWKWQAEDAFGRDASEGTVYFHREKMNDEPPCTLCLRRDGPGHLLVGTIVPDENTVHRLPLNQYVRILNAFDAEIAGPAAEGVGGMTSIGTSTHSLEDHFSPESVKRLERFCKTSNASDHGTHLSDQRKWLDFLLYIHRNNEDVDCDTFGKCLETKNWWPKEGIPKLVHEYDFAMRLLEQADE